MTPIHINQRFKIADSEDIITVADIQYTKVSGGKKEKLKDPIYVMFYDSGRPYFTTYYTEVLRMIDFKRWIKI